MITVLRMMWVRGINRHRDLPAFVLNLRKAPSHGEKVHSGRDTTAAAGGREKEDPYTRMAEACVGFFSFPINIQTSSGLSLAALWTPRGWSMSREGNGAGEGSGAQEQLKEQGVLSLEKKEAQGGPGPAYREQGTGHKERPHIVSGGFS